MKPTEQKLLDAHRASRTQAEANETWDAMAKARIVPKRTGDAPFSEPGPEPFCPHCLAEEVASATLAAFTKERPEVQMSYDAWMMLGVVIEVEIKGRLGVLEEDDDGSPHEHPAPETVQ